MKKILMIILIISACNIGSAQNLKSVLDKNSKALGLSKRKSISNLKTTGYVVMSDSDARIPFKMLQTRPDLLRIETSIFGFKAIQTYDGKTAWQLNPTQGLEAIKNDPRDMEFIAAATALDGPFSVNKDDKYTLKYLGADTYLDKAVEVVVWTSDKERLKYYISTSNYYIEGIRYEYQKNGGWYSMEYRIKSYQEYEGTMFPKEVSAVINGVEMISLYITSLGPIVNYDPTKFGKPSYEL
ncbi:hypothetical protein ACFLRQ_02650 [Bacteroidota bacterium]